MVAALTWLRTDVVTATVRGGAVLLASWAALTLVALASGVLLDRRRSSTQIWLVILVSGLAAALGAAWERWGSGTVGLPAMWLTLLLAVAVSGFLLSDQVGKSWMRAFSLAGLVILCLLLITIGRNERVNLAAQAARTDYRQLNQILQQAEDPTPAAEALVVELCALTEGEICEPMPDVTDGEALDDCLPGWTYQAFDEWTEAASIDRRVAATAALARCELRAFDPGAISENGDGGTSVPENETETPADAEEADQQATQPRSAIDSRVAVAEALSVQRSEANPVETLAAGADGILSSISGPSEFAVFRFSGETWLVLLAFALLWYRRLEIRSGSHGLGPVDVVYEDVASTSTDEGGRASDSDRNKGKAAAPIHTGQAVFKQAVVQNVPEPGAVPGAQALAPVGDLISSSDAPNKWLATGVVDAVRAVLATRSGYTVMYSAYQETTQAALQDGPSSGSTFVVFIRVRDSQNGNQMASMRFESDYLAEASQLAGYWAAGWIISRSRNVPEWAIWSERDAHAFYSLQWRQGDDLPLQAQGVVDPNRIQAPANALILAQRAYAYLVSPSSRTRPAREGPFVLNALEDFARAAYLQPRYPVARYRRAVALSSLMDSGVNIDDVFLPPGGGAGPPSRSRLLHLFRDLLGYGSGSGLSAEASEQQLREWIDDAVLSRRFPTSMRRAMLELAYAWLVEAQRFLKSGVLAQLRPSERRFWHEFNRAGTRRDWTMLVRVSQQIVKVRLERTQPSYPVDVDPMPPEIVERAREADSHWQISYNIGCYHSLMAANATRDDGQRHREQALDWLERCLDRPFSGQLVREWIDRDPDLAGVRAPVEGSVAGKDAASWSRWRLRVPLMPVQIRPGDRSSAVEHLQKRLNRVLGETRPRLNEDGQFGELTLKAVREFQFRNDLRVTGTPDLTMLALLETLADDDGPYK